MSKYVERKTQIIKLIKPYIDAFNLENDTHLYRDIGHSLYKDIDEALILICKHQLNRTDITSEMKKYLLGKIYRTELEKNKRTVLNGRYPWTYSSRSNCHDIADDIGKEYNMSGASILKYDLYTRAIDKLAGSTAISVTNILSGTEKIPAEKVLLLSKMTDADIEYLKVLFNENFYKLAGYIFINNKTIQNDDSSQPDTIAMIKQMPQHDPDSMVNSLSFTIPSWINSIRRVISTADMALISNDARSTLKRQINDLNNTLAKIFIRLEEKHNE